MEGIFISKVISQAAHTWSCHALSGSHAVIKKRLHDYMGEVSMTNLCLTCNMLRKSRLKEFHSNIALTDTSTIRLGLDRHPTPLTRELSLTYREIKRALNNFMLPTHLATFLRLMAKILQIVLDPVKSTMQIKLKSKTKHIQKVFLILMKKQ